MSRFCVLTWLATPQVFPFHGMFNSHALFYLSVKRQEAHEVGGPIDLGVALLSVFSVFIPLLPTSLNGTDWKSTLKCVNELLCRCGDILTCSCVRCVTSIRTIRTIRLICLKIVEIAFCPSDILLVITKFSCFEGPLEPPSVCVPQHLHAAWKLK